MVWQKIKIYLVCLWLFLFPWQTRLILRPGILNGGIWEYGIVGIYATEILLWLIVLICLFSGSLLSRQKKSLSFIFVGYLFLRAVISFDWLLGLQQFGHLLEAVVLVWILKEVEIKKINVVFWFVLGLTLQAGLGIAQFLLQKTWASKFLGLTLHEAYTAGASILEVGDGRLLRAYGGLPHPNIFGGFMLAGIIVILFFSKEANKKWQKLFFSSVLPIFTAALFFSFSRSAWIGWGAGLLIFFWGERKNFWQERLVRISLLSIFLFLILSIIYLPFLFSRVTGQGRLEIQSTETRLTGYAEAGQIIKKNFWFGAGLGNYTLAAHQLNPNQAAWDYQPAHNVFLLILVEIGFLGALLFCLFFRKSLFQLVLFLPFLPALMVDHYLWSLWCGVSLLGVLFFFKQDEIN